MKILLLAKRFYTKKDLLDDRYGRLHHLPAQWARLGAEVEVIALDYRTKEPRTVQYDGFRVRSIPSSYAPFGGLKELGELSGVDVLVASGHLNIARLGAVVAQKANIPAVLDVYDYYPAFMGRAHPLFAIYLGRLLRRFKGAMTVSQRLQNWCQQHLEPVARIPNGVEPKDFTPIPQAEARQTLGVDAQAPVLGLFGSMSRDLGLDDVLAAFQKLRQTMPNARLLLAGAGGEAAANLAGVTYAGMLDQRSVALWASACDCLLIPYRDSLQVRYSQSARLSEYLALQKPIVVTRVGDAATWFPANYPGWCDPASPPSLHAAMQKQLTEKVALPLPKELTWEFLGKASLAYLRRCCGQ
ncbi:glycosyltransferase [Cerasicoccus frondis]|uniref:glycosyltransferase n=1 Tax=Cerasicoccus frondis TaxID=490090 RepID=UPI0028527780|nr:glycosyltransferase [Cerasicoccus frondis]